MGEEVMSSVAEKTLALAGVAQAASMVHRHATGESVSPDELEMACKAILNLNPNSTEAVFGVKGNLWTGIQLLRQFNQQGNKDIAPPVIKYFSGMVQLALKLQKQPQRMSELGKLLAQVERQIEYFDDITHEAVIGGVAKAYQEVISTMGYRIHVVGNPQVLQQERNAQIIRTLLLFGIRSAILWRQTGGSRLDILLRRKQTAEACTQLLTH